MSQLIHNQAYHHHRCAENESNSHSYIEYQQRGTREMPELIGSGVWTEQQYRVCRAERRNKLMSGLQMEGSSAFTVHYHFPSLANQNAKHYNVSTRKCSHFYLRIYRRRVCVCVCVWRGVGFDRVIFVHVRVLLCVRVRTVCGQELVSALHVCSSARLFVIYLQNLSILSHHSHH